MVVSFHHYTVSLKLGYEFCCSYHDCQREPLNLLVLGLNSIEHLSKKLDRFLNLFFLLYEHRDHRLVSKKYIQIERRAWYQAVNIGDYPKKSFKLENASLHSIVHSNFSFLFKVVKE